MSSNVNKTKKASNVRKRRYRRMAFSLVCLCVFVIGGVSVWNQYKNILKQRAEMAALELRIGEEEAVNGDKLTLLNYMKTDEYMKNYAREQLGLMLPGDIRFVDENAD